ncbi:MAG: exopolysaccharide biosynthesis polyprenyl glycosylphosphotransferase [Candidatus Schekmanbacteria bacterium]|nr:exopolysaccharide biosynthesis polyprenyl glycosylphosphotransferase [Candidatus Schekmanbacteria bacterium]
MIRTEVPRTEFWHPTRERPSAGIVILGNGALAATLHRELDGAAPPAAEAARNGRGEGAMLSTSAYRNGNGRTPTAMRSARSSGASEELSSERLRDLIRAGRVSRIVITEPNAYGAADIASTLIEGKLLGIEIEEAADFYEHRHHKVWLDAVRPDWLIFCDGFHFSARHDRLKRWLDIVCAAALLVLAAPILLLIALAIKLESRGPVLFAQDRVGKDGDTFMMYKFRSMRHDAEQDTGPMWARDVDDRVTRVGRILRRLHLDEVPQVINVLRGDMTFVGPRPERPCFVRMLGEQIPYYDLRHYIKPGITGWAQVSYDYGNSIEDAYEKLQYDLYYAKHASVWFDVFILLRTIKVVIFGLDHRQDG